MKKIFTSILIAATLASCTTTENDFFVNEDAATFAEVGSIDIGETGAAEISAYDPQTKRLFVVNNSAVNKIDVLDFAPKQYQSNFFYSCCALWWLCKQRKREQWQIGRSY
jgi:hypothetical protein